MRKYLLFLGLFIGSVSTLSAQKVVLAEDLTKDSIPQKFGPNRTHFRHLYVGYGFVAGPSENKGSAVKYGESHEWQIGYRYKYKVGNVYALGFDLAFNPQTFFLKQSKDKTLPNAATHEKEKLKFTNIGLGLYNRINFGKRGNYVGNFIDLGVYGNWLAFSRHIYKDEMPDPKLTGSERVVVRHKDLTYVEDFNYGLLARLGFNRYVFYGNYRLSDLFDPDYTFKYAELPRVAVGLQISLHK
jgi:hypothetical protein